MTNSIDLSEEIVSAIEKLEKLTKLKNKMQNAQNFQSFHTTKEKSLEELTEQKKVVEHIKSSISELSNSCTAVENSLNKATDTFSQSKNTASSRLAANSTALTGTAAAIGDETWQLRDICKGRATARTFPIYQPQFSLQTQEVFVLSGKTILVVKVQGESITMDRKLSIQGAQGNSI